MEIQLDATALDRLMAEVFPQIEGDFTIETVAPEGLTLRLNVRERHLRPGGTVSGPAMFSLADCAMYLAVLSRIGPVPLAVTTNCSIDFLRKPEAGRDLLCEMRMLKLGRSLAVGDGLIFSEGGTAPVARASLTYSIPPKRD